MASRTLPFHLGFQNVDDGYVKGRRLGKGDFGTTYLCTELTTGCHFACKHIRKKHLTTMSDWVGVLKEHGISQLLELTGHPNIMFIQDAFEDERCVYFVMELCKGGDLFHYIVANGPFTERRAATLMKEIMSAIEVCHARGVVHRDLKVKNLISMTNDKDSLLKVIDFGLAEFFYNSEMLTDVVGTPWYTAPEVMGGHHGPKADIWSVGVVLYIFLVGFPPFKEDSMEGVYKKILYGRALHFERMEAWRSISKGPKNLIKKMLKYDPNKRYSAREVLEHPWIKNNTW